MKNCSSYSLTPSSSDINFSNIYDWWDDNDFNESDKKRKKKKKAKKKAKRKKRKQAKRDFQYRMLEKTADITLHTLSDIAKMYAATKLHSSD